jgi:hypothetical protein
MEAKTTEEAATEPDTARELKMFLRYIHDPSVPAKAFL